MIVMVMNLKIMMNGVFDVQGGECIDDHAATAVNGAAIAALAGVIGEQMIDQNECDDDSNSVDDHGWYSHGGGIIRRRRMRRIMRRR